MDGLKKESKRKKGKKKRMRDIIKNYYENLKKQLEMWKTTKKQIEDSILSPNNKYTLIYYAEIIINAIEESIKECEDYD